MDLAKQSSLTSVHYCIYIYDAIFYHQAPPPLSIKVFFFCLLVMLNPSWGEFDGNTPKEEGTKRVEVVEGNKLEQFCLQGYGKELAYYFLVEFP